ncbi:putative cofilin [Paratrimastix pyriformis]|uniref:Cofilin n=1 Tax=Paratrimastix pyriformis TaxID=342808 RepID=A0ABQ8UTA7_9EUKA|nr:putative cofilin [Paratrimastix pyriformis]
MMNLGITADPAALAAYEDLKMRSNKRYVVFKIENSHVVVDFDGAPEATIQDLLERLPAQEPRYVLFKYPMPLGERGVVDRMCFMMYVPQGTPVRMRTIYPGNARPFKSALTGIQHELEVDRSTLVDADIQEKLRKTITDA